MQPKISHALVADIDYQTGERERGFDQSDLLRELNVWISTWWEEVFESETVDDMGEDGVVRPPLASHNALTAPVPDNIFGSEVFKHWKVGELIPQVPQKPKGEKSTWGSRWGRRREGECRLAPLLSPEKPQSGCKRLRLKHGDDNSFWGLYSFEPVPMVMTTTNPAKKQRMFSSTGCLNMNIVNILW